MERVSFFIKCKRLLINSYRNFKFRKSKSRWYNTRIKLGLYTKGERDILKYKNKHLNESCLIIGNGPSLRIEDLEAAKKAGITCFSSNKIYKAFPYTTWRPDYYACTDVLVFSQNWEEITSSIKCPMFFSEYFKFDENYTKWRKKNIQYIHYRSAKQKQDFPEDALWICSGGSVTYVLIVLAWMMGFRKFFVIGCDHSYKFYDTIKEKTSDNIIEASDVINQNYFIPGYMKRGEKMGIGDMDKVEEGYLKARQFIESHGGSIYNVTRGGALEVFERKNVEDIIGK